MRCESPRGITMVTLRALPLTNRWDCQSGKGVMLRPTVYFSPHLFSSHLFSEVFP